MSKLERKITTITATTIMGLGCVMSFYSGHKMETVPKPEIHNIVQEELAILTKNKNRHEKNKNYFYEQEKYINLTISPTENPTKYLIKNKEITGKKEQNEQDLQEVNNKLDIIKSSNKYFQNQTVIKQFQKETNKYKHTRNISGGVSFVAMIFLALYLNGPPYNYN